MLAIDDLLLRFMWNERIRLKRKKYNSCSGYRIRERTMIHCVSIIPACHCIVVPLLNIIICFDFGFRLIVIFFFVLCVFHFSVFFSSCICYSANPFQTSLFVNFVNQHWHMLLNHHPDIKQPKLVWQLVFSLFSPSTWHVFLSRQFEKNRNNDVYDFFFKYIQQYFLTLFKNIFLKNVCIYRKYFIQKYKRKKIYLSVEKKILNNFGLFSQN